MTKNLPYNHSMKNLIATLLLTLSLPLFAQSGFKDCYAITKPLFTIQHEAIKACAPAGEKFKQCYEIAKPIYSVNLEAIKVCIGAGPGFLDCYAEAKPLYTFAVQAISACAQK